MTPILQVITEYCGIYIDDINLSELASVDAPLYARRCWQYLKSAIPLFSLPVEMQEYLIGNSGVNIVEPQFASYQHTVGTKQTSSFVVDTGKIGFEICSCRVKTFDNVGNVILTPIFVNYNKVTGQATISASEQNPINANSILDFDFYTDGYFVHDLSPSIQMILGLCFQVIWDERFIHDWVSDVDKVEDKSFSQQNRANKMRANDERLKNDREKLAGELRRFEQNKFYEQTIINGKKFTINI